MPSEPRDQKLGIWMSTSLVIGNMIGAGIFLMPAALAPYGGISILGWLVSSAGALLLARVFSRLTILVPDSGGGPYAFARAGFGDFAGFLVAWGYWLSICVANAAIAIAFTGALGVLFPVFRQSPLSALAMSYGAIWLLTWVNSRGVRSSGSVQVLTTILKLLPLLVLIVGGWFFFSLDHFIPFNPSGESSLEAIAITGTLTLYAFLGLESATVPSDKVKDPEKTVPRATMIGTLITTLVYVLSTGVVMGMIPRNELATSTAPFADAMRIMAGSLGEDVVAIGTAIAAFGALNRLDPDPEPDRRGNRTRRALPGDIPEREPQRGARPGHADRQRALLGPGADELHRRPGGAISVPDPALYPLYPDPLPLRGGRLYGPLPPTPVRECPCGGLRVGNPGLCLFGLGRIRGRRNRRILGVYPFVAGHPRICVHEIQTKTATA